MFGRRIEVAEGGLGQWDGAILLRDDGLLERFGGLGAGIILIVGLRGRDIALPGGIVGQVRTFDVIEIAFSADGEMKGDRFAHRNRLRLGAAGDLELADCAGEMGRASFLRQLMDMHGQRIAKDRFMGQNGTADIEIAEWAETGCGRRFYPTGRAFHLQRNIAAFRGRNGGDPALAMIPLSRDRDFVLPGTDGKGGHQEIASLDRRQRVLLSVDVFSDVPVDPHRDRFADISVHGFRSQDNEDLGGTAIAFQGNRKAGGGRIGGVGRRIRGRAVIGRHDHRAVGIKGGEGRGSGGWLVRGGRERRTGGRISAAEDMERHRLGVERAAILEGDVEGGDREVAGARRNQGENHRRTGTAVDGGALVHRMHHPEAVNLWQRDVRIRHEHPEERRALLLFNGAVLHRDGDRDLVAHADFGRIDLLAERGRGKTGNRREGEKGCQAKRSA